MSRLAAHAAAIAALLAALLSPTAAWAQVVVRLVAEVDAALQITGVMEVSGDPAALAALELVDPLPLLPQPQDDLVGFRTWPGRPDAGELSFAPRGEGAWTFSTRLPERYGAMGALPGEGLWANGGWHPQPLLPGEGLPLLTWEVELQLPPDCVATLNGALAQGGETLRWSGEATRLSLALLEGGRASTLAPGLVLLEHGVKEGARDAELLAVHQAVLTHDPVVVVETPAWRRLARPGEGVVYLSEAAFRLSPPLRRFHRQPVAEALLAAALPIPDPWLRAIVAAPLSTEVEQAMGAGDWLRFAAWLPMVDALLYNGRSSFHSEVFGEVFPADPLRDDLAELFAPRTPGAVVAAKLDDRYGRDAALDFALQVRRGRGLEEAAEAVGIDVTEILVWAQPYPEQDLKLEVGRAEGWVVSVRRDAPADAPPEPVVVSIGGRRTLWEAPAGPGETSWTVAERPRRVALDPDGHVQQSSALHDTWPARWSLVGTAYPTSINFSSRTFIGLAAARLRKSYDTHNAYDGLLWIDEQTLLGAQLRYVRYAGPLLDRRARPHRVAFDLSPSLLSESFRPTPDGRVAMEAGLSWSWDSRVNDHWPTAGHRFALGVDAGFIPGSEARWGSASASATQLLSPHPRLVFAGRLALGQAVGDVDHRLLGLGGSSALRSLPANLVVGRQRGLATLQVRALPLRDLSMPLLWLTWLDEVSVHGGVELGGVRQASALEGGQLDPDALLGSHAAVGLIGGVVVIADGFGTIPGMAGLTFARSVWRSEDTPDAPLQVLLRFDHEF